MKNFGLMLLAVVAMVVSCFLLVSCDGSTEEDVYTISFSSTQGNLPDETYQNLSSKLNTYTRSFTTTKDAATAAFEILCVTVSDEFLTTITSVTGASITMYLKNSSGDVVDSRSWPGTSTN